MNLVRFTTEQGNAILVETTEAGRGFRNAGINDRIADAQRTFGSALAEVGDAAETALVALRERVMPDGIQLEFGIKFSAESGAVIAKAAVEGSLKVTMSWGRPAQPPPEDDGDEAANRDGAGDRDGAADRDEAAAADAN